MSYCRSSRFNYLPCSESQKMSIGMVVDLFDKPHPRSTKDAEVSITHAEREASGHAAPNMKKDVMSFGTVNACGDHAQDGPAMIKTSQLNDNALINDNNHVYKQASTSSVVSFREKQTRHPFHLIPNQAVLQPVTGEKIETGCTGSRREGKKNSVAERYGEFACGGEPEVSMPVIDMLHEQPDKMENRCKETLRMKLQEILGAIPSVDKKCDNSRTGEVVANEVMQVQTDKGDAQFKHKQNSDTIETDSEKDDKTIRRPVTCLLARKRAPAKSRSVNLKTKSLSCDNEEHQSSHAFSFVEKYVPLKSSGQNLCCSRTEMLENVKQSCGVRPDDMTHDIVDVVNIQRVITGDKTEQPEEEMSLEGRMMSSQHGHQYENLEPEAAMQNKNFHCSPVIKEKDQLQNVECPISPEVPDHQKSLSSQSPVDDNDNLDSPFLKMAKTVHNSLMSHQLHRFVHEEGANVTYEFKYSPATEDNTGSSDDEDTYNTIPEPLATENAKNGLLSPEGRLFESSGEVLSAEKVYPNDVYASPEIGVAKKPLLFQTKRHCSSGVDHSNSNPAVQSPEASESSDDGLLDPLENGDEDEFARVVSLLGLALERVKTKMMSATNKRCSDILVYAAEEIHLQLCNAESQIQTDSGRITSLSKLKRKHLETRLQEQQEHLKVIYDKFRKEIHQYIQDSRGALEELEAEHAELKGAIERQNISRRKLLLQAEAAVESQLNDAHRQIAFVHQADSLRVHGVAIPTIDGIRNVLKHIGAQTHGKGTHVLWINLREEPVVYINGRPFVLRDVEKPFSNLEYTGINRDRVEDMESRLKEDIFLEAARYGSKVLVTDELPDGQMVDQWEPVDHESVKTPLEVYEELKVEGFLVNYERVPVTDEKSPKESDFDILVDKISQADLNMEIIFNCQMGRGRTTTGMVIATLIYLNRIGVSAGIPRSNSIGRVSDLNCGMDNFLSSEEAIRRGEYTVIRSLIRVLEGGVEGKKQVDKVIDKCASMQNLREAIATYRKSILHQPDEMKREASLSFFVEYLERYYFLICFAVYLHTERAASVPTSFVQSSFADWMKARPELYSIIRRLLRRDPMGALGYRNAETSLMKMAESTSGRPYEMSVVAALRDGAVLGSQTVLKSDHCPGCQNLTLPERVEGAPNFREVPGFSVYGVANPTIDGIRSVIRRVGSSRGGRPVFWHNMREEPVIYINGKPFVLREVERPYKNMLEYTGIDCERVERMEARLKEDILREAERFGGAIMVIHETADGQIFDAWEHVNLDSVQTPLEVFSCLEYEGYPVKYARVPITDGKAPKSSDFDTLAKNVASASKDTAFVFNCQMGRGRTTTGTVIACLVKLRMEYGRPIQILRDDFSIDELYDGYSSGEEPLGDMQSSSSSTNDTGTARKPTRAFGINDILLLWKITRLFDNGVECREALDAVIDRCSALQNIRDAVLRYREIFNRQHVEPRVRRLALNRGAEYLERYFRLIAFSAYLGSEAFDGFCGQGESKMTFKSWLQQRPEVQAMKWSIRLRPGRFFTVPEDLRAPYETQHGDAVMEAVIKARNGSVLGTGSILKMYFFPGQRTSSHIQIHGAPHVYKVDGYPVYSMATPTITGAKEMLAFLVAKESTVGGQKVVITDLREEAVVYINGTPFVLRELNKPVDTLKHVGITGPVVEHMEARLKEDIISEVTRSGGRMLLHREEYTPTLNQSSVVGYWENIFTEDVKTPAEVYASLKDEGYDIMYRRIPLTRERDALSSDVDAIQYCKDDSAGCYLFVSHTGFGGVAYAMAIICIRLGADGNVQYEVLPSLVDKPSPPLVPGNLASWPSDEAALKLGEYRDILSLTRVLAHGPRSKEDVDDIIERCAGAGHIRDDIVHHTRELKEACYGSEEHRAYVTDMGVKALRRYFFLITFRSYLYCASTGETKFSNWMDSRPELGYLCSHLRIDK